MGNAQALAMPTINSNGWEYCADEGNPCKVEGPTVGDVEFMYMNANLQSSNTSPNQPPVFSVVDNKVVGNLDLGNISPNQPPVGSVAAAYNILPNVATNNVVGMKCGTPMFGGIDPAPGMPKVCYYRKKPYKSANLPLFGRYVELSSTKSTTLNVHKIDVFSDDKNISQHAVATQSDAYNSANSYPACNLVNPNSTKFAQTAANLDITKPKWFKLDFGKDVPITKIVVTNRMDRFSNRLVNAILKIMDSKGAFIYTSGVFPRKTTHHNEVPIYPTSALPAGNALESIDGNSIGYKYYYLNVNAPIDPTKVYGTSNLEMATEVPPYKCLKELQQIERFDGKEGNNNMYYILALLILAFLYYKFVMKKEKKN
jgi:hypothetical protein